MNPNSIPVMKSFEWWNEWTFKQHDDDDDDGDNNSATPPVINRSQIDEVQVKTRHIKKAGQCFDVAQQRQI